MTTQICEKEKCTGCTACKNICPVNAISMGQNEEGFFYPVIDTNLCVDCKKCQNVCPANHFEFVYDTNPKCYAVMASDQLRRNSSSGAFFPVLAQYVLAQGGLVAGAAFDENMILTHIVISKKEELDKLKGSKYLQSQMLDVYTKIKAALLQNMVVLFSGTPCQVAGLKNFLGREYDRLLTVDLICHGVPSQKVFDNYLRTEFPDQKVIHTNFRDNKDDWGCGYITTTTTTTTTRSLRDDEDSYLQAFFANISLRLCCYDCQYAKMPRCGDFTMGDFWGVPKEMDDHKGTSLIFLNTPKADNIFQKIKNNFIKIKEYPASLAVKIQPHLSHSVAKHPARKDFFYLLKNHSLNETISQTVGSKKNIGLMNFHWENVNFGALITSYALNRYLNDSGYYARNIDYIPSFPWIDKEEANPLFDNFRKKHLPVTRRFNAGQSLSMLNDEFSTFIVGSDQVWRHEFIKNEKEAYFLSFANCEKKLISYAASFGIDTINAAKTEIDEYKMLMSLFDAISVREDSGIKICEEMGVRATKMCDPVFLLSQQKWCDLAEEGKVEGCEDDVVFYTINEELEEDILKFINGNKDVLKYKSVKNITWKTSVEEWLFRVKNCKFFVTDSFHGSCFAIIFNKPFVCVNTNTRTSTRMLSLFDMLGIKGRYFSAFDDVNMHNLLAKETDYQKVNKFLEEMRKKSEEFLIAAIESPIDNIEEKKAIKKRYNEYVYQNALKNKNKIYFRYLKYKLLSRFPFGKKRNKYKQKRKEWRIYYKQNKLILKSKGK